MLPSWMDFHIRNHIGGVLSEPTGKANVICKEGARWIIESMEVQKVNDCYHGEFYSRRLHRC